MEPLPPEGEALLARVIERARRVAGSQYKCCSLDDVRYAEEQFGFPLPPLLRELYLRVPSNPGPLGLDLLPLVPPLPQRHETPFFQPITVISGYHPSLVSYGYPPRLLHLTEHGCGEFTDVDCNHPALRVIRSCDGIVSSRQGLIAAYPGLVARDYDSDGTETTLATGNDFALECDSLAQWLEAWSAGHNLNYEVVPRMAGFPQQQVAFSRISR